jgi:WD40 repeat protein
MNLRKKAFTVFVEILFGLTITAMAAMAPFIQLDFQTEARVIPLSDTGHDRANAIAFSPNGDLIAVGTSTGIYFFDAGTYQQLRFVTTETWVRALAFSPDGSLLATGSYDPVVRLWRVNDGGLEAELKGHTAWVRSVSFSPNGRLVASASDDDTVRLWDLSTDESVQIVQQDVQGVSAVAFSPGGNVIATGGFDSIVRLWRVDDASLLRELTGHKSWVRALAFSPDGSLLASGGFDTNVILWRVEDGVLLHTMEDHASSVLSLAFSPDGSLLASGSVDKTVRLWQIPTGESFDLLSGHTDFVFSVGFSPEGKSLVSGSVDNTIRIWQIANRANPLAQEEVSSPSNCISCHHPLGINLPPRVIETSCSTCHGEGALVRNWCPWIPRSAAETTVHVSSDNWQGESGVPHSASNFGVVIALPGNGEHLYSGQNILTLIPINGYVFSTVVPLTEIQVDLEIWTSSKQVALLSTIPNSDGAFSFTANIQPNGELLPSDTLSTEQNCNACHTEARTYLPTGEVHLVVYATTPDGTRAFDERWIYNDTSFMITLPVRLLKEDGQPSVNIPVIATTLLYEWRSRTFSQPTDFFGSVELELEALSQVPTVYQISVPPVTVNGVLYEGMESPQITLQPGMTEIPEVTIYVRERLGQITGTITDAQEPVQVLAIHLPDGASVSTQSSNQGEFSFANLLVGQYEIAAIEGGSLQHVSVDLTQSPTTSIEIPSLSTGGTAISGQVTDENDNWLPFAWVSAPSTENETDVATGTYTLSGLPEGAQTVTVRAPGFYSQSHKIDPATEGALHFSLVQQPETEIVSWGEGEIIIPAETIANEENGLINIEQGWLWGEGQSEKPITIQLDDATISLTLGRFALEKEVGQSGWLYLFDGEATVNWDTSEPITVLAGEMIYLGDNPSMGAVKYDLVVVQVLRAESGKPISDEWQPGLEALISAWVGDVVVFIAQAITLITYVAAFLTLFAFPFAIANQALRVRQKRKKKIVPVSKK